ncbi:MAG: NupC/NupG family nucleoside CNT transporter [Sandaracinaceae bacterium]|nr:NupC/NupG family nucleoside CNT transporter [Sandaracinaceae bacterium]
MRGAAAALGCAALLLLSPVALAQPRADADAGAQSASEPAPRSLAQTRAEAGAVPLWQRAISLCGLGVMVALAWLMSVRRDQFPLRLVLWGLALQLLFGALVLETRAGLALFAFLNDVVAQLLRFTDDGSRFLFGAYLDERFTVALNVLPTIIFFSSLMSVLYHVGVMQRLVRAVAWVMQRTLGTSGAETLSAAANIFVGQTEAPLVVRPFVERMTRSELMAVMTCGFATVAGGVLAAYVGMLHHDFPDIAGHLIAASVMSAPAALVCAKVMIPETEVPETQGTLEMSDERTHANVIDAAASGAGDGMKLALNVAAMLLAFLALVAMINYLVELPALLFNRGVWSDVLVALERAAVAVPDGCASPASAADYQACVERAVTAGALEGDFGTWTPWNLQRILGTLFWPLAFVMGVPSEDCSTVAALLGEKLVLNEFVAYVHLVEQIRAGALSPRSVVIVTYALCGFANFGSIAIQIGGIGGIAPSRRADLAKLGLRAMIAGTLAAFMTACVAGVLV